MLFAVFFYMYVIGISLKINISLTDLILSFVGWRYPIWYLNYIAGISTPEIQSSGTWSSEIDPDAFNTGEEEED